MTALYAILAIICLGGILMGAYLIGFDIGFDDGVKAEQMRRRTLDYVVCEIIDEAEAKEMERHALTHADMVKMEAEAKNNEKAIRKDGGDDLLK